MNIDYLDNFLPLIRYMHELLGPNTELVLYDVEKMCVYYVENPFDDDMYVGGKMRSLERKFLKDKIYEKEEYIINYRALSRNKDKLKSSTFFLKKENNRPYAILTINQKVDLLIQLRDSIDEMIQGRSPYDIKKGKSFYESFDISVNDMVSKAIEEELNRFDAPSDRLTANEKQELTTRLDKKGIFLVKGAITDVAKALKTTETTIYRYLYKK